jgi:hypothetical protein
MLNAICGQLVQEPPRIQEAHVTLMHLVCDLVEKELFASPFVRV